MKVPDSLAGQVSHCPMCRESMTIPIPPGSWWAESAAGEKRGPVSRDGLDKLVAESAIDASFQLRQEGETSWRAASELFPQLKPTATPPSPPSDPGGPPLPPPPPGEPEVAIEPEPAAQSGMPTIEISDQPTTTQASTHASASTARARHARQRQKTRRNMTWIGIGAVVVIGGFGYWGIRYGERSLKSEQIRKQAYSRYAPFGPPKQITAVVDPNHEDCFSQAYSFLTIDEKKYFDLMDKVVERELNLIRMDAVNKGKKKTKGSAKNK